MWIKSEILNQHHFNLPRPSNTNLTLLEDEHGFANVTTIVYGVPRERKLAKTALQKWLELWGIK